jgi:hypothetical protein
MHLIALYFVFDARVAIIQVCHASFHLMTVYFDYLVPNGRIISE